jgi:tetratricopeptide (TPR) repeat protein
MVWAWFGLLFAATLGVMLLLDLSGVRPQHGWRLSTLPPSRQRRHLLLQRLLLACAALWALIESLPHVLPSRSEYMVAQNVITVGLAVGSGLIMIYLFGYDRRAVSEEAMGQVIRRARARDNKRALVGALRAKARVMIQQRRWEEAERVLAEGLAVAQAMPDPQVEARLLEMWGLLHAQKGEVEGARERLAAALDIFRRRGAHRDARRVERALADLPQGVRA